MVLPDRTPAFLSTLSLILLLAVVSGCRPKAQFTAPPPLAVSVATPVERDVAEQLEFTATTRGLETVEVRARVFGTLEHVHFEDGARVSAGQLLFSIERAPYARAYEQAEAQLALREAELRLTEITLERKEAALADHAVSEIDVIATRARRDIAAAAVNAARAALASAELQLSYTRVHAPCAGTISRKLIDEGNLVAGRERNLLATIVRDDPIYAYFHVSERELLALRARFRADASIPLTLRLDQARSEAETASGTLDYIDNAVDSGTGTIEMRGVFDNADGALLPGLFAHVRVPLGAPEPALLVPERALGSDQRGPFLLVVDGEDLVEYRPVELGAREGALRVVRSGIATGERVIVKGIQRARPGSRVEPVAVPTEFAEERTEGGDASHG